MYGVSQSNFELGYSPKTTMASTLNASSVSNFQNGDTLWCALHTGLNTISWTDLDAFVDDAKAAGIESGLYVLYGCPTFIAQPADQTVAGAYGFLGENSYPSDLSQLTWFCQQFAARNVATWGGFFKWVQLFNEPEAGGEFTASGDFFKYSATQFVNQLWTAYSAFKAADPSLELLCPGTYDMTVMATWLDTTENVSGFTKHGYDCFDHIALHPYYATPNPAYSGRGDFYTLNRGGIGKTKELLDVRGKTGVKYYATEWGFSTYDPPVTALIEGLSDADRALIMQREILGAMRVGFSGLWLWGVGNAYHYSGNIGADPNGVDAGFNAAAAVVVGRTPIDAGYCANGAETVFGDDY